MTKKYFIGIAVLGILIIGITFLKNYMPLHLSTNKTAMHKPAPLPKEATVILNKNGFSPATVTIKVGSAVRWKNESGSQQTVNSDNYPTNQLHKELNFGIFANNSSVAHTFTKAGTYGYHNQLNHKQAGKVIVIQ